MISDSAKKVMRRKAGEGRPAPEIDRMTPARAWRAAMPRAAEQVLGVEAAVRRVEEDRQVRDALSRLVPDGAILLLLEGPAERYGFAFLDATVLAGLLEALTARRVTQRPPVPRVPTKTDALICADFVDALLEAVDGALDECDEHAGLTGFRYAGPLVDRRALGTALAEGPYGVHRLDVDLGDGAKQGQALFAFPAAPRSGRSSVDALAFARALEENVMRAPAAVEARLWRFQAPISAVQQLAVGDVVRVPLAALAAVSLETPDGAVLAEARLGQQAGFRAVRVARLAGEAPEEPPEFEEAAPAPPRPAITAGAPADADEALDFAPEPAMAELPDLPAETDA